MKFVRSTIVTLLLVAVCLLNLSIAQADLSGEADSFTNINNNWNSCPLYDRNPIDGEVYDFIVVGSGASGSIVASRLAQSNQNYSVLVLEAGGPSQRDLCGRDYVQSSFYNDSRGNLQVGEPFTRYDVPFYYGTVGASQAYSEDVYQIPGVSIGRLVGGGMAHNGMVWFRPTEENLQDWNVTGWEWENYLPYLKRAENVSGTPFAGNPLRGTTGPIKITATPFKGLNDIALFKACLDLPGEFNNTDPNGATRDSCGYLQTNTRRGVRSSSAIEYLRPQLLTNRRINTRIHAQATKILFATDYAGKKVATGVEYYVRESAPKYRAYARREVILAAGAINTPKLLMLSGIGPAAELQKFNIPVVRINENVGRHLRNHKVAGMAYNWTNPIRPNIYAFGAATLEYATYGTGILAQFPLSPDIFNFRTRTSLTQADVTMLMNWGLGSVNDPFTINPSVWVSNPFGANGTVNLNSSNPFEEPLVDQNLAAYAPDVATLARGIQKVRQLFATDAARSFFDVVELTPGPAYATNAQLINYLSQPGRITGAYHYMGTTRMGRSESVAVVNNRLSVFGVGRLRVVDASIIPGPIFFGAQTAVVGVAEKAAAIILNDNL